MEDEARRLNALRDYAVLDTPTDEALDDLVELAAVICETPIALISFVDETRQWFKAKVGLTADSTPRDVSFCTHAIEQPDLFVVEDALEDARFCANPLVLADPCIRFYAGMPLLTPEGALGTLCVIDRAPRRLRPQQSGALRVLARQVVMQLKLRRAARERLRDLDAVRLGREALAVSEERYRAVVASLSEGIVLQNDQGEIEASNASAQRILGLSTDQLAGRSSLDPRWRAVGDNGQPFLGEDHPAMVALRTGRPQRDVVMGVHKPEGSLTWISINAQPIFAEGATKPHAVVASFSDITARRAAERAREESERQLELAVQATGLGIWDWSLLEGRVHYRGHWESMLGYEKGEIGESREAWQGLIHPDDLPRVQEALSDHLLGRSAQYTVEHRSRAKDGTWRTILSTGSIVERDELGRPSRMIGTRIDITERRRIEEQLALADRMVSLGGLAAGVAHEINNPLTFVMGNIAAARSTLSKALAGPGEALAPKLRVALDALRDAELGAERVRDVVHDLRALTKPDEGTSRPVSLSQVLDSSINIAQHELRHRARLVRDYSVRPYVNGQEPRLGQLFVNLLVNAAQAIEPGALAQNVVTVSMREGVNDTVEVQVRDTGKGISAEDLPRIFDPFFTTKAHGTGTGLGLSICHRIVEGHGGTIAAESIVGQGTVIRVVLPRWRSSSVPEDLRAPDFVTATLPPRACRILVIDDEPAVGRVVRRVLDADHEVFAEDTVASALERIRSDEPFDVILCDVVMPELGGREFLSQLRECAPHMVDRVIFMTGGVRPSGPRDFLASVHNSVLEKPFSSSALRAALARCLDAVGANAVASLTEE